MIQTTITLKPYGTGRQVDRMEVCIDLENLHRVSGEELCSMQLSTVTIPGCSPEGFLVTDGVGEVPVWVSESKPYPYELRNWMAERETEGTVEIRYTVRPRQLRDSDICGPYFDFRCEDGGANSAGISFLVRIPGAEGKAALHWDLSEMPEGSRGVCTFGEGDVTVDGGLELLRQSYFAVGDLHSITEGEFGFYWLTEPPFAMEKIADYTRKLFGRMQVFFRDQNPVYRIFVRKDPFLTSGGTALYRSYMFGWNDTQPFSVEERRFILAHEMVHNWPHLNDEPYGVTTWYSEGTAEFYSVMLPLRMGLITPAEAMAELQKRTDAYYTNPTRGMENMEAAAICWQDRRAQRISYGRGMLFLANVDAEIRSATGGTRSLDDVMLKILEKGRAGENLGNKVFLDTVLQISGLDVTGEWEAMKNGVPIVPGADCFDGHFTVEEKEMPEADTGKTVISYRWSLKEEANR